MLKRKKYVVLILFFITICIMLFVGNTQKGNYNNKIQTYSNKNINFSVEFPNNWDSKISERLESTPTQDASPDGGIEIYVEGNKEDLIYVYGQIGHVNFPNTNCDSTKFVTSHGNKGILYTERVSDRKDMHLIFDEGFHAAHIYVSSSCFKKNEKKIMDLLTSINLQAVSDK